VVHDRRVGDNEVTLGVSGKVKNGNLVMYDKETESLWLQETGEALQGKRSGLMLQTLPSKEFKAGVRWDEWKRAYPSSKVLSCDHCMP
jgi:hypothetical protein